MVDENRDGQLEILQKQFDKDYGVGTFVDASSVVDSVQELVGATPSLDIGLNGGVPEGSWLTLSGPSKAGKSTLALTIAAAAQAQGRMVIYVDIEGRIKKKNLVGIEGLDTDPRNFRMIRSTPEKILTGPEFLNQGLVVLETIPRCVLIMDSFSALSESKEMEEGVEAESRGNINKLTARFTRIASQTVCVQKSLVIGITHRIANTGWGGGQVEKISNALKYQRDIALRIKKVEDWEVPDPKTLTGLRQIGKKVVWLVEESALGAPGAEVQTYLRYGVGYDKAFEIFQLGLGFGFINKAPAGGWITLTFLDNKKMQKFQGDEKAYNFIRSNPAIFEQLKALVVEKLTGVDEG